MIGKRILAAMPICIERGEMINSRSTQMEDKEEEKFLLPTGNTFPGLLSRPSCAPRLPQKYLLRWQLLGYLAT